MMDKAYCEELRNEIKSIRERNEAEQKAELEKMRSRRRR